MLKCVRCGEIFDDDDAVYETVCWEDYYGVGGSFQNKSYGSMATCPCCGSDEIEEYYEEDENEE